MNRYEKKEQKDKTGQWLNDIEGTASDRKLGKGTRIGKAAASASTKMIAGLGGGFLGAAIGPWSLLGFVATAAGEVIGSGELAAFGVGMVASGMISDSSLNGPDDKKTRLQKAKDRMKVYGKGIMQKFWLDKIVKKKTASNTETKTTVPVTTETTNGMGEVKYYTHPNGEPDPMDLRELEKFEQQIQNSAENYAAQNGIEGAGDDDSFLGTEDRIY